MSTLQSSLVSLAGLLVGASVAIFGAVWKSPELTQLGCTICGGALGMFVPTAHRAPAPKNGSHTSG